jgi:hypothetical protein
MEIITHTVKNTRVAEVIADEILIKTAEEGAQLLADLYYQEFDLIIVRSEHLNPEFFDLKNGLAGEILQKCSNFRIRLTVIGDFSSVSSKSLRDFIYESNKGKLVNFVGSVGDALEKI